MSRVHKISQSLIGKEFETKNHGKCFVVDYKGANNVTVMFYDPVFAVKCTMGNLNVGNVKNPYNPNVYGKGYIGVGEYTQKGRVGVVWRSMLLRCYDKSYLEKHTTYKDVEVCEEWLNFQNFARWFYSQKYSDHQDKNGKVYHIDKDILVKGSKVYSPETCCFIPQEINVLFTKRESKRGDYPIGVRYHNKNNKFESRISYSDGRTGNLGYSNTQEEAFIIYKRAKEVYIKEVAEKWKGLIDYRAYEALMKYKVEITD